VILSDPRNAVVPSPRAVVVPFTEVRNRAIIKNVILDKKLNLSAVIDSGLTTFSTVSESAVKSLLTRPIDYCWKMSGTMGPGGLGNRLAGFETFKTLQLGSLIFPSPVLSVVSGTLPGPTDVLLLGNPFLSHFRVTLDYRNKVAIFDPSDAVAVPDL